MTTEHRKQLKQLIKQFMKDNSLNWKNMQIHCIKKNLDFPVGWRTLYRFLKKGKDMSITSQKKIFKHFEIETDVSIYGVLQIKENEQATDIQS